MRVLTRIRRLVDRCRPSAIGGDRTMKLIDYQREHPGCWLAVKDNKVVAARDTPHQLAYELAQRGISGATMFRSPAQHEPELVGLG